MTLTTTPPVRRRRLIVPDTVDDVFDRPGSIRAMAVLRIVLGPVVVIHLWPDLADAWRGISYSDRFHEPWFAFLPVVPAWVQYGMVTTGVGAAVAMTAGWHTRLVAPLTAACVTGNMFLSQTHFRHNRAFLIFLLWAVALSASGRVLSVDARRARSGQPGTSSGVTTAAQNGPGVGNGEADDRATLWPMWTVRVLASSVYLASGFSKLIDPDWISGLVLWDRAVRYQHLVAERVPGLLGDVVVSVSTTRWVHVVTSPMAVAMELFVGLGLWFARTRIAAVWVAVFFHLSIELAAAVEVFSVAAIAALVIWTTPSTGDRIVVVGDGRWIRRLDWLARFDVHDDGDGPLLVTDRDGSVRTGREAWWFVASRLPLTFFVAAPAGVVSRRRRRRTDSAVP